MLDRPLLVRAQPATYRRVAQIFDSKGYAVEHLDETAPPCEPPVAVILEVTPGEGAALELVRQAAATDPRPALIALAPPGRSDTGVAALREGADDFLVEPFEAAELEIRLERAVEHRRIREEVERLRTAPEPPPVPPRLPGQSHTAQRLRRQVERLAAGSGPVLLVGERGVGKTRVARAIHARSPRASRPLLGIRCGGRPAGLLVRELFGQGAGVVPGSEQGRPGCLERADRGALLVAAIDRAPLEIQERLVRFLREGVIERFGDSRPIRLDVRLFASSEADLGRAVEEGRLREDLFLRLHEVVVEIPPLRERPEDIPLIADELVRELGRDGRQAGTRLSDDACALLSSAPWPANLLELRNALERALICCEGRSIQAGHLPAELQLRPPPGAVEALVRLPAAGIDHREIEREMILQALSRAEWVQKDAASLLRMSRRQLNYRIQRLGITHPSWRRNCPPQPRAEDAGSHCGLEDEE